MHIKLFLFLTKYLLADCVSVCFSSSSFQCSLLALVYNLALQRLTPTPHAQMQLILMSKCLKIMESKKKLMTSSLAIFYKVELLLYSVTQKHTSISNYKQLIPKLKSVHLAVLYCICVQTELLVNILITYCIAKKAIIIKQRSHQIYKFKLK